VEARAIANLRFEILRFQEKATAKVGAPARPFVPQVNRRYKIKNEVARIAEY
jgi:hypothetical protein